LFKIRTLIVDYGFDVNIKNEKGQTPLHLAVAHNHINVFNLLMELKANPLAEDNAGSTPKEYTKEKCFLDKFQSQKNLHAASKDGDLVKMIELFNQGANVDQQDDNGQTALHLACIYNQLAAVKLLVEQFHANLEIQDYVTLIPENYAGDKSVEDFLVSLK